MNKVYIILLLITILSCQKIAPLGPQSPGVRIQSDDLSLTNFHKMRVDELFVVLFKDQLSQTQWTSIFNDTQKLSANKRVLLSIEGLMDPESEKLRDQIIPENADLLQKLSENSVYLLNWSFGDENCRFLFKEVLNLVCKPRVPDNPLNGGLPEQRGEINLITPNPVTEDIKVKYLNIVLYKDVPRLNIQLRLKLEKNTNDQFWFKGDVKIKEHSFSQQPFEYGYSEMSLSK